MSSSNLFEGCFTQFWGNFQVYIKWDLDSKLKSFHIIKMLKGIYTLFNCFIKGCSIATPIVKVGLSKVLSHLASDSRVSLGLLQQDKSKEFKPSPCSKCAISRLQVFKFPYERASYTMTIGSISSNATLISKKN